MSASKERLRDAVLRPGGIMSSFDGSIPELPRRRARSRVDSRPRVGSVVEALRPYAPPRSWRVEAAELGLDASSVVMLAANESPVGPSPRAIEAAMAALSSAHRYPDADGTALKRALADHHGVAPDEIVLGNGSSEVIELLVRTMVGPNEVVAAAWPSFVVYRQAAQAQGRDVVLAPLVDDVVDLDALASICRAETKLCFLANPNNPTGTSVERGRLETFLERIPRSTTVVVDEAYREFAEDDAFDGLELRRSFRDQVIVLRTFSKAYGLAGLRVGFGVMSREIASYVNRMRQPYNVSSVSQAAALAALSDRAHVERTRRVVLEGRQQLAEGFVALGLAHIPSDASFIVVRLPRSAAEVERALVARGIFVRSLTGYGMPDALRITVGPEDANAIFLDALADVLAVRAGAA